MTFTQVSQGEGSFIRLFAELRRPGLHVTRAALLQRREVERAIEIYFEHAEADDRRSVAEIPDGVYTASGFLDGDGINEDIPVHVVVTVTVDAQGDPRLVDDEQVAPVAGDVAVADLDSGRAPAIRGRTHLDTQ